MAGHLCAGIVRQADKAQCGDGTDKPNDKESPAKIDKRERFPTMNHAREIKNGGSDGNAEQQRNLLQHARQCRGRTALRCMDIGKAKRIQRREVHRPRKAGDE